MENILITGATGFVGVNLTNFLLRKGFNVYALIRSWQNVKLSFIENRENLTFVLGDVLNKDSLERIVVDNDIDTIFHLAAQSIVRRANENIVDTLQTNIIGTANVLEVAKKHNCYVVYTSTDKVYGKPFKLPLREDDFLNPIDAYSLSKAAADNLCRIYQKQFSIPVLITRACNLYGEFDLNPRIIPNTIRACLERKPVIVYQGLNHLREYLYIQDFINILYCLSLKRLSGVFNIGSGEYKTQGQVISEIMKNFDEVELHYQEPPEHERFEIKQQYLDCSKLKAVIDFNFTRFDEGIKKTVEWWRDYYATTRRDKA